VFQHGLSVDQDATIWKYGQAAGTHFVAPSHALNGHQLEAELYASVPSYEVPITKLTF
jgi:hypothetical protein